jgi:hypothetical protein
LDALAEAVANSTEPGNPEILDNLVLSINNYRHASDGQPDRYTRVSVDDLGARCSVSGDPLWVRGQVSSLQPLLEEARPFKKGIWYAPRWAMASWGTSFGLWVSWLASFAITGDLPDSYAVVIASVVAGAIMGYAFGGALARRRKVEIWISRDDFPAPFWRFTANEVVTAVIALLTLAAAITFGVIAHKDAQKDEGGAKSAPVVSA